MKIYGLSLKDFFSITLKEIKYALQDQKLKDLCKDGICPYCCYSPCQYDSTGCDKRTLCYTRLGNN